MKAEIEKAPSFAAATATGLLHTNLQPNSNTIAVQPVPENNSAHAPRHCIFGLVENHFALLNQRTLANHFTHGEVRLGPHYNKPQSR